MKMNNLTNKFLRLGVLAAVVLVGVPTHTLAANSGTAQLITTGLESDGSLRMMANRSVVLTAKAAYKRVNLSSPDIADINTTGPMTVVVTAKKPGSTQLILWDDQERAQVIDITVVADLKVLEEQLKLLIPGSKIEVTGAAGAVILRGRVPDIKVAEQATLVAAPYGTRVMNFLEVGGGQQVMLKVRFAEVSRGTKNSLGFNAFGTDGISNFYTNQGGGSSPIGGYFAGKDSTIDSGVTLFARGKVGATSLEMFITALRQNNLLRMLAEPNVIAISGQEASFLAGGEFPIPVPQAGSGGGTTITVQMQEYGIRLKFVPIVLGDGRIRLKVNPEVSDLDFSTAVQFNGYVTPGLTKRTVQTVVELDEGQTFAIAGLLSNTINSTRAATPLLGDIPVLGALFRSTRYERRETELVVLVTPVLVSGMNPAQVPAAPGEKWRHPSELGLLLMRDAGGPETPTMKTDSGASIYKGDAGFVPAGQTTDNQSVRKLPTTPEAAKAEAVKTETPAPEAPKPLTPAPEAPKPEAKPADPVSPATTSPSSTSNADSDEMTWSDEDSDQGATAQSSESSNSANSTTGSADAGNTENTATDKTRSGEQATIKE